jgi:hypothetical protein
MDNIKIQYNKWYEKYSKENTNLINDEELKNLIIKDLSFVSKMDVKEYTLYQKYCEIHYKYPIETIYNLFGEKTQLKNTKAQILIEELKNNIWKPNQIDDYLQLKPILIECAKEKAIIYNTYRNFTSTQKNNNNIGRNIYFLVKDEITDKNLGIICISSDFLDLTPRDSYIKWSRKIKTQEHMINHTAIGSTIIPFQPFGYNYVGGKLLALLCLSDTIQNLWKEKYGNTLVGITTTSLYGNIKQEGLSQYDNLDYWSKMGFTEGSVSYEVSKSTEELMRIWLKNNYTNKYFEWYVAKKETGQPYKRDHRNRSRIFIFNKLKIPKELISSKHKRGIYYSNLYKNSNEFLRKEIKEKDLIKSFNTSITHLVDLWKEKYAKNRVAVLKKKNKNIKDSLFYDDIIYMSWVETREKYLKQVGR